MPRQTPATEPHNDSESERLRDNLTVAQQDAFVRIRRPLNPGEQIPAIPTLAQLVGVFTGQLAARANAAANAKRPRGAKTTP